MRIIDKSVLKSLKRPNLKSHKGQNGRLLVVAGSEKYHGSLLYAIKAAAKIVDLIYVLTTKENRKLVEKLKSKTASFIAVNPSRPSGTLPSPGEGNNVDCILIGPGMGVSRRTYNLVRAVLKSKIRAVLDADALRILDFRLKRLLNAKHILTPHKGELKHLLSMSSTSPPAPLLARRGGITVMVKNFVKKNECTVVLKGKVDIVATPSSSPPIRGTGGEIYYNYTGNEGMTKGGTGDVLAGLIAGFYCKNDAYTSAAAGVYVNGAAGDELYKKVGPYYDAEDLIQQIPRTLWNLLKIRNSQFDLSRSSTTLPRPGEGKGRGRTSG